MKKAIAVLILVFAALPAFAQSVPKGYAPVAVTQPIINKTQSISLGPDLSALTPAEERVVELLIKAGKEVQLLHENMRHREARKAWVLLSDLDSNLGSPAATQNLLALYYSNQGPIVRDLDNVRSPMLPVDPKPPGGAVYPWDVTKAEIDAFLTAHPEERDQILHPRTVVRRVTLDNVNTDLAALNRHHPVKKAHPNLEKQLIALSRNPGKTPFYAVPYALAYADEMAKVSGWLNDAATAIATEDPQFAGYLRARAQDLITNSYVAGDSAWVTGHFKTFNAQIGAYETYDDELYGVKAFYGLNVLLRDHARSDALGVATKELQRFEDSLPYDEGKPHKKVRADIPVGVYDVVADFGQSRGGNTATILPNDAETARKFGRTILLRRNIMEHAELFGGNQTAFASAVAPAFANDLTPQGGSQRTLWHEIGHYLGADRTRDGRDLDEALLHASGSLEEMKADLVSLYLAPQLEAMGYYTADQRKALYASGVRRVLLKNKPERAQVYQTMELMQWNYFLDQGALTLDATAGKLVIHYDKFPDAVTAMLRETLALQQAGDPVAANAFIDKWTEWRTDLHEVVAQAMRNSEQYRFLYVTYAAVQASEQ